MARFGATAWVVVAAICAVCSTARGQSAAFGVQDAAPPPEGEQDNLLPPRTLAQPPCGCRYVPLPGEPTETELIAVIVGGATVTAVSYLLALVFISNQPHSLATVDSIPIIGTVYAAQRNALDDRAMPLLLFSAGVQAIGVLVAGVAGNELAVRRRLMLDVGASPSGAGATLTWRY